LQAEAGLIGEIDREQTRDGVIVCRDGFKASTISAERFRELTADLQVNINLEEIDDSSVFCVLTVRKDT
jgi:2-polyprenyl-6-hydroxyphenyl methylase/3-demethylubiquinone-9 3-methyltransferase